MKLDFKVLMFAIFGTLTMMVFFAGFIETRSVMSALALVFQIYGMMAIILIVFSVLVVIGNKIFK